MSAVAYGTAEREKLLPAQSTQKKTSREQRLLAVEQAKVDLFGNYYYRL